MEKTDSIGIFDSGAGGLTVMNAIQSLLPHENIVYFGDTKNVPYGDKSAQIITEHASQSLQFLYKCHIKLAIIACHTVCTTAFAELQTDTSIPLISMTEPSLCAVKTHSKGGKLLVLGTSRTIASGVYQTNLAPLDVVAIPCPSFVPLIEAGQINHPELDQAIFKELSCVNLDNTELALLACTHFPLIQRSLQKALGPSCLIIDPAIYCAAEVKAFLTQQNLLNDSPLPPQHVFYASHDTSRFQSLGGQFLGQAIQEVLSPRVTTFESATYCTSQ